jgi:cytoskeletal protein RodZ
MKSQTSLLCLALVVATAMSSFAIQQDAATMPAPTNQQDEKAQLKESEKQAKQNEKAAKAQAKASKAEAKSDKAQRKSLDANEKAAQTNADTKAAEMPAPTSEPEQ